MPGNIGLDVDNLLNHAPAGDSADARKEKLKKATQGFESVFVGLMLKQMRKSLDGGKSALGNSSESKLYKEMMDEALAGRISEGGSFGLAKTLYKRMESHLGASQEALVRENITKKTG